MHGPGKLVRRRRSRRRGRPPAWSHPSRRYHPVGTRKNPLADNLLLVGVGVATILAVGFALWSTSTIAAASTPGTWPASQFLGGVGAPGTTVTVGEYVLLTDGASGKNIIAQVTSVSADGTTATGTVYYAPVSASESVGDTVSFNVANVISSSSSSAILQGLL